MVCTLDHAILISLANQVSVEKILRPFCGLFLFEAIVNDSKILNISKYLD